MRFEVKWLKGHVVIASTKFERLEMATRDAEQLFSTYKRLFDATGVEVWDDRGFRHYARGGPEDS